MKIVRRPTALRKSQFRIHVGFVLLLPLLLLVTFAAIGLTSERLAGPDKASRSLPDDSRSEARFSSSPEPRRAVFPYSLIPGGVRDARELTAALRDPVVARHYSDFRLSAARTIRLDRSTPMYVSYRLHDRVYWTRDRVLIPAGEALISDGQNLARQRCGNRLSSFPRMPVLASEPPSEQFENADFVPPLLAGLAPGDSGDPVPQPLTVLTYGPSVSTPAISFPVVVALPGTTGNAILPPVLPVTAPEPGSATLILFGALLCGLASAFLSRDRRRLRLRPD